ncbi:MAG: PAS domain S-box protein [Mariprofundales bacterium]|nr:PAS domain S-box protein [Mariprofundales bacterium]
MEQRIQHSYRLIEALQESESYRKMLFERSPAALALSNMDGQLVDINPAFAEIIGYSVEEALTLTYWDLTPKEYADQERQQLAALAQHGQYGPYDKEYLHKNGHRIPVRMKGVLFERDGKQFIWSNVEDITQRKARESFEALEREILAMIANIETPLTPILEKLVLGIEQRSDGGLASILLMDAEGEHLTHGAAPSLPEAYCQALDGVQIGAAVGSCGTAAYTGKRVVVADIATDPLWADYKALASSFNLGSCWSQPILDSGNKVLGTFAIYHNHPSAPTENALKQIETFAQLASTAIVHAQAESSLRESERRFHTLAAISPVGIFRTNADGHCLYVNECWCAMAGLSPGEASGDGWSQAIHPDDRDAVFTTWNTAVNKKAPFSAEYRFQHKNGQITWVIGQAQAEISDADELIGYVGTITDISDRIMAEEERAAMQAKAEHTQRLESLGVLAGGIAHDFNNILTAILGNAAMAERKVLTNPERAQQFLSNIVASSDKAAELCKQMLAYSGKGKFVVKAINLSHMVEEISRLLSVSIAKNVVLKYNLEENLPAVEADSAQLQQVIMNLVINASDAISDQTDDHISDQKGGVISISTGVMQVDHRYLESTHLDDALSDGRYVFLEVSDTGCGMDKETQQKLFEPFFTTKFTGHGLGMSAVLGIIRGHFGAIKVYSEPDHGTTFKVLLPASAFTADMETGNNRSAPIAKSAIQGTVLIIDDEEDIRAAASMMLEDIGFHTLTATDGEDGVRVYRQHQHQIDAVLLDMTMPKLDGKGCFRELRRINPSVKVILSSGYNEQESTSMFAGQGLAGFLQKPYFPEKLQEQFTALIQQDEAAENSNTL